MLRYDELARRLQIPKTSSTVRRAVIRGEDTAVEVQKSYMYLCHIRASMFATSPTP